MTEKRGRGRPRRAEADAEILEATLELLRERGYRELNVDVIADQTGIAKTTIYRRWPTKAALAAAAIDRAEVPSDDPSAILASVASRLALLGRLEGDALDAVSPFLGSARERLAKLTGSAEAADAAIGKLLMAALFGPAGEDER